MPPKARPRRKRHNGRRAPALPSVRDTGPLSVMNSRTVQKITVTKTTKYCTAMKILDPEQTTAYFHKPTLKQLMDPTDLVDVKAEWLFYRIKTIRFMATSVIHTKTAALYPHTELNSATLVMAPFVETGRTVDETSQLLSFNLVKMAGSLAIRRTAPKSVLTVNPLVPVGTMAADWGVPKGWIPTSEANIEHAFGWTGCIGPFNPAGVSPGEFVTVCGFWRATIEFAGNV